MVKELIEEDWTGWVHRPLSMAVLTKHSGGDREWVCLGRTVEWHVPVSSVGNTGGLFVRNSQNGASGKYQIFLSNSSTVNVNKHSLWRSCCLCWFWLHLTCAAEGRSIRSSPLQFPLSMYSLCEKGHLKSRQRDLIVLKFWEVESDLYLLWPHLKKGISQTIRNLLPLFCGDYSQELTQILFLLHLNQ